MGATEKQLVALRAIQCGHGIATGGTLPADTLETGGPTFLGLLRRLLVFELLGESRWDLTATDLAAGFSGLATRAGDLMAVQAIDWWTLTYTGAPLDGRFFVLDALPRSMSTYLSQLLREAPHQLLAANALRTELGERVARLQAHGDRITPTSRGVFDSLIVEPTSAILRRLEVDPGDSLTEFLEPHPKDLLQRADPAMTIPRNGRRWPELLIRAQEFQEDVRAVATVARVLERMPRAEQGLPRPPVQEGYAQLLLGALAADVGIFEGPALGDVFEAVGSLAPAEAASGAALLRACHVSTSWSDSVWQPIAERIARDAPRVQALVRATEPSVAQPLREYLAALRWGLVADADVWLDEAERNDVSAQAETELEQRLELLSGVQSDASAGGQEGTAERLRSLMRSARSLMSAGDFDAARLLVAGAEDVARSQLSVGHPRDVTAADQLVVSAPETADEERTGAAPTKASVEPSDIRRVVRSGNLESISRLLRETIPPTEVLHAVANEVRWPQRPVIWPAVRAAYLEALQSDPSLEGLLFPPLPSLPLRPSAGLGKLEFKAFTEHQMQGLLAAGTSSLANPVTPASELAQAYADLVSVAESSGLVNDWAWAFLAVLLGGRPDLLVALLDRVAQAHIFVNDEMAWMCADAYERLGDDRRAALALDYFWRVRVSTAETTRWHAAERFCIRAHVEMSARMSELQPVLSPPSAAALTVPQDVPPSSELPDRPLPESRTPIAEQQAQERLAREEYESGDRSGAEARLLLLLERHPRSPGAFLLLKIYREARQFQEAARLVDSLRGRHAASWRLYVELARVLVECEQPASALSALGQAHALDAKACLSSPDHQRLTVQARDLSATQAKATATLGGHNINGEVVTRLAVGGNLDPSDWARVARQHAEEGRLAEILQVAVGVVGQAPWIVGVTVDAVSKANANLQQAMERNELCRLVAQSGDVAAVMRLASHLRVLGQNGASHMFLTQERDLLTDALAHVPKAARPSTVWSLIEVHRLLGDEDAANLVSSTEFPPAPIADPMHSEVSLPPLQPILPHLTLPSRPTPGLVAAVAMTLSSADAPDDVANAWVAASAETPLAIGSAVGWLVAANRPVEALEFYRELVGVAYPSASTSWNVATALARIGRYADSVAWFRYNDRVSRNEPSEAQRQGRDAIFHAIGEEVPHVRATAHRFSSPAAEATIGVGFSPKVRWLLGELEAGRISDVEAEDLAQDTFDELKEPTVIERVQLARLWIQTGKFEAALAELRDVHVSGKLPPSGVQALVDLGAKAGLESDCLRLLSEVKTDHIVLLAQAKLHYLTKDIEGAKKLGAAVVAASPTFDEGRRFLEALEAGKDPMPIAYGLQRPDVIYLGATRTGDVELLLELSARRRLADVRVEYQGRTVPLGDMSPLQAQRLHLKLPPTPGRATAHLDRVLARYEDADGRSGSAKVWTPRRIHSPRPLSLPFDPTQPVRDELFVGRQRDMSKVLTHYEQRRQILFVGGPRQVGKTSLVRRCRLQAKEQQSPVQFAIMVGDVYVVPLGFLVQLAQTLQLEMLERGHEVELDLDSLVNLSAFSLWFRARIQPLLQGGQIVVAIDEVQVLLDRLASSNGAEGLADVAGLIRTINADPELPLKFLLLGSCSYASVRDRLSATNLAAEILEVEVGFLDQEETAELVTKGFAGGSSPAFVLDDALATFWSLTAGYPNHVHLLARDVERLLVEREERVATEELVLQAADSLVKRERAVVEHLLGREREGEYQQRVLVGLASFYGQDDDVPTAPLSLRGLVDSLGAEYLDGIERFERLGLLRRSFDQSLHVANGLIRRWLIENALMLELRREADRQHSSHRDLSSSGYEVQDVTSDEIGEYLSLRRGGEFYRARRATSFSEDLGGQRAAPSTLDDVGGDSTSHIVERVGPWIVFTHATGRTLAETSAVDSANWEKQDTLRVVRVVQEASAVILERTAAGRWTHGNLSLTNLIDRGRSGTFVADWDYGTGASRTVLSTFRPGPFRPPEQAARYSDGSIFIQSDDVFALGAILFHAIDSSHRDAYPLSSSGCADTAAEIRELEQVGCDADLRRLVNAMLSRDESERPSLDFIRATLSSWLQNTT